MKMLMVLSFLFIIVKVGGQPPETISASAPDSLFSIYRASLGTSLPLYSGREFYGYYKLTKDNPFYSKEISWNTGSVLYENMWYKNAAIMYDLYKDEVVIKHPDGVSYILFGERVQEFSMEEKLFLRIYENKNNSATMKGFYQRLLEGKIILFAKRIKTVEEDKSSPELENKFIFKSRFYIFKDGLYTLISSRKSLLSLLKDKKNELQQYIRKDKIKYKPNPELYITLVAEFYNKLYK